MNHYQEEVQESDTAHVEKMIEKARDYNRNLHGIQATLEDPFIDRKEEEGGMKYGNLLSFDGTGIMGFLEIPAIHVNLPIYHGTSEKVLEMGCGHLKNTSLPIGGESTHAVITGHTGMNHARLFTDLISLKKGNLFYISVADKVLAYEICRILVVLPTETEPLSVCEGKDYVTLMTCTPYGKNTHRLLVTGKRIPYKKEMKKEEEKEKAESQWRKQWGEGIKVGIGLSFLWFIIYIISRKIMGGEKKNEKNR